MGNFLARGDGGVCMEALLPRIRCEKAPPVAHLQSVDLPISAQGRSG